MIRPGGIAVDAIVREAIIRLMSKRCCLWACFCLAFAASVLGKTPPPLELHPANPHYFLFRGKPAVLITSGEHYGAVLNLDFNFEKYLDVLKRDGLNLTRTFSGAYVEPSGAFNIARNTLAPGPGRFICPWARSDTPGYANGGNKFDLARWDNAYFRRLKAFVTAAAPRGVVVELNLFCPFYEENQWQLSPQNVRNNINSLGAVARTNVYTLDRHGGLLSVHEAMARKIVTELKGFDNIYYEICNEPYFGGVTLAWQRHIADIIAETEKAWPRRHLISQNIANGSAKVDDPFPAVSIFNFHYANPPDTVGLNYGLAKVIGDNETGFRGTNDAPYRVEAWEFIIAGGGLFNNLDYSFVPGQEDGSFVYPASQPGGGNATYRRQLRVLRDFIGGFEFIKMRPDNAVLHGSLPAGCVARALVEPGRAYAIYLRFPVEKRADRPVASPAGNGSSAGQAGSNLTVALGLELPAGAYQAEWIDPLTGAVLGTEKIQHAGGIRPLAAPPFAADIALRVKAAARSRN